MQGNPPRTPLKSEHAIAQNHQGPEATSRNDSFMECDQRVIDAADRFQDAVARAHDDIIGAVCDLEQIVAVCRSACCRFRRRQVAYWLDLSGQPSIAVTSAAESTASPSSLVPDSSNDLGFALDHPEARQYSSRCSRPPVRALPVTNTFPYRLPLPIKVVHALMASMMTIFFS